MPREIHRVSPPTGSTREVPRALWIGGALLGLATAGVAGALIMRSVDSTPVPLATAPSVASLEAQTAPRAASVEPQTVPMVEVAPARAHHVKSAEGGPVRSSTAPATARPEAKTAPAVAAVPSSSNRTEAATPGDAVAQADASAPYRTTQAVSCSTCGVVESVHAVQQQGQATGVGAVAGGVLGGVVGHQVGGGSGKTAMTVLGAIGGVLAGNEVEKRSRSETLFNVQVRMEDGSTRVFQQAQSMAIGTHVIVESLKLRIQRETGKDEQSHAVRTAAQPGASS
jgi:outer membrane lipoprotein SlyB